MFLQSSLFLILHLLILRVSALDCASLASIAIPNVSIASATHLAPKTTFPASADPTCFTPTYNNTVPICRVIGSVTTSTTSSVSFEMWLPDTWYGRTLTGGNGGFGGCIEYSLLDHASTLNFAAIATNNGHDGSVDPSSFLMPQRVESVTDFSHRAVQVATVIGKQIATTYYGTAPHHSYYNGCSAGGRQGFSVASRYPDLFDGVLAGAPAVNWHHMVGAPIVWATDILANTSRAISPALWTGVITPEILKQCDGIDGRVDGIITDTSLCSFNPSTLLCKSGANPATCLTADQVSGLKAFYAPVVGSKGEIVVPGYELGAEADTGIPFPTNGVPSPLTINWFNYAIYGQPDRQANFSVADILYADTVDPVGISTWSNAVSGLGQFEKNGGKLISYHGTRDPAIPSGNSKEFHNLVSSGLGGLDSFYRLFMIPGMGHCMDGPGAWRIGQGSVVGVATNAGNKTDHSVLLSLVDWVEGGNAPGVIVGTDMQGNERKHCLWPSQKSVWNGATWNCVAA